MNKDTHFGFEKVSSEEKQEKVDSVFTSVAENYDLMNDVMSFGLHRFWKKIMIELAGIKPESKVLDLAGGTADIAKEIHLNFPDTEITVADINAEMLVNGKKRSVDENFFKNTSFCQLNGELLPFGDKYFLSKFNFLRIVLLFFLNFDVKFPFIKDSQFLYPSTLSSASTAATLSSWSQIVEIADSKIIS